MAQCPDQTSTVIDTSSVDASAHRLGTDPTPPVLGETTQGVDGNDTVCCAVVVGDVPSDDTNTVNDDGGGADNAQAEGMWSTVKVKLLSLLSCRGGFLIFFTLGWITLLVTASILWATYLGPHHATSDINGAVAAYDAGKSVLNHVANGTARAIESGVEADRSSMQSQLQARVVTGWTTGLTTTTIAAVVMRTVTDLQSSNGSNVDIAVSVPQRGSTQNLTLMTPRPNTWRRFTRAKKAKESTCHGWCRSFGSEDEGGSVREICPRRGGYCECTCFFRRYLTAACYVVVDGGSSGSSLAFRNGNPGCSPPYTLTEGHLYTSRYPTGVLAVELRSSNDPLLVALAVTDGSLHLDGRDRWQKAAVGLTALTGVFTLIVGFGWLGFFNRLPDVCCCNWE